MFIRPGQRAANCVASTLNCPLPQIPQAARHAAITKNTKYPSKRGFSGRLELRLGEGKKENAENMAKCIKVENCWKS